jgi:phage terminase large subunit
MKGLNIDPSAEIYADAAEPNRIEEITRAGFNIFPADKDVNKGIDCLKSMELFVTKDSDNLIRELRRYSWQVDRAGNVLDKPVKVDDHLADSTRYAVWSYTKKFLNRAEVELEWV